MMKKINLLITVAVLVVLRYAMSLWYKTGIIRDEYNISGNAVSLSLFELFLMMGLPIIFIIVSTLLFFVKKNSNVINTIILLTGIGVIIISGFYIYKENNQLREYTKIDQLQELTLETLNFVKIENLK